MALAEQDLTAPTAPLDPAASLVPVGPAQLDALDDSLHFGWSWSRLGYTFRRADGLRMLDAGCGSGLSTLGLARLNPGATVLGVDASPELLDLGRARAAVAGMPAVDFRTHDLATPLPDDWGLFDFIACRRVLDALDDPAPLLRTLARALAPKGLLFVTFPTHAGVQAVRQMRQAAEALAPPGAGPEQRAELGFELFRVLRPDHPVRLVESALLGLGRGAAPDLGRFRAVFCGPEARGWTLAEAASTLRPAGLALLYAAARRPWGADRVLDPGGGSDELRRRVGALAPDRQAELMDALDPALHAEEYRIYAGRADDEPRLPAWPEDRRGDPSVVDRLIPHRSGLAARADRVPTAPGRVAYRAVTGALTELDDASDRALQAVDGRTACAALDRERARHVGVVDDPESRRARWLHLAERGFVLLEDREAPRAVDCRHLGPIRDRLDCACPRRWVRACELHKNCTLAVVSPADEAYTSLQAALGGLGTDAAMACAACPDYNPEE